MKIRIDHYNAYTNADTGCKNASCEMDNGHEAICMHIVNKYLETLDQSKCRCEWITHPLDKDKPIGRQRKIRGGVDHPHCPIHTKAGLILNFIDYIDGYIDLESDIDH